MTSEFLITVLFHLYCYVRVVQSDPVHPGPHEQVPGAKHVPLFEHEGEQIAKTLEYRKQVDKRTYLSVPTQREI
jgi:hypothetical protein